MPNITYNRIPYEYFITQGSGSSNYEQHAGSTHIAYYNSRICDYNIQTYSSILPRQAKQIDYPEGKIKFGSELYTIMSIAHGTKDEFISCGILTGDLYDDDYKIGSLVCEVSGNKKEDELKDYLKVVIDDLHIQTYSQYTMKDFRYYTNSYIPDKKFGTCLISLCFYSFRESAPII
jgi:arginine decarboxylase